MCFSGTAIEGRFELVLRLVDLHHIGFVPFAFAEPLHTNQVNAFTSLFLYKGNAFVLNVFNLITGLEFRIVHGSILRQGLTRASEL